MAHKSKIKASPAFRDCVTGILLCLLAAATGFSQEKAAPAASSLPQQETRDVDPPHWGNGIDCATCHVIHRDPEVQMNTLAGNALLCQSCHIPGSLAGQKPFAEIDMARPGGSGTSHAWNVPAESAEHGATLPTNPEMAVRVFDGHIVCSTCHNQHSQEFPHFLRASNANDALCKECHGVRDVGSFTASPENRGSHPVGVPYPAADSRFHSSPQNPDLRLLGDGTISCSTCHGVHFVDSGGANGGIGDGNLLRAMNDDALCQSCHTYPDHMQQSCLDCHQPHDPARENIFLVKPVVSTPNSSEKNVKFFAESGQHSFADGDTEYSGICEVCHTATSYHRNNDSGNHTHNAGTNCTTCHSHADGFQVQSCTACHDVPQDNGDGVPPGGRRAIVADFQMNSHHLQSDSLQIADCGVCHELTQHMAGSVQLVDRNDPAVVYALAARPMGDATAARAITPFCLSCHYGEASPPFSDGMLPPLVDADLWSTAAHNRSDATPIGCMGDGDSFGCHSTAHGSQKRKLLAPADASQPPVAGDPTREEEGFCYSCHDADGPASDDIQTEFSRTSRHNVSALDQGDGSKVECKNCHNPRVASAASPLIDPDGSGATPWGGTAAAFCLACHDGGAPAGVSFPTRAPGTGYDKSRFPGTTLASRLGGDSCLKCHEQHGSAFSSLLNAQYSVADRRSYRSSDYQLCWACHSEGRLRNDSNKIGKLHDEHLGEKIPCIACHEVHGPHDRGEPGLISFKYATQHDFDFRLIDGRTLSSAFWISGGQGFCYLECHGKRHKPKKYDRG